MGLPIDCPTCPSCARCWRGRSRSAFDSDQHLFEPWWGGVRALVSIGPGGAPGDGDVRDRRRRRRGSDGGASGTGRDGRPRRGTLRDPRRGARRRRCGRAGRSGRAGGDDSTAASGRPVAFLAFDLLHLDGRSLLDQPLVKRREALRRVLRPGDEVVAVPAIATEGRALVRCGRRPGHRRDPCPPAARARTCRGSAAGCGGSSRRSRAACPTPSSPPRPRSRRGGRAGPGADQPAAAATTEA